MTEKNCENCVYHREGWCIYGRFEVPVEPHQCCEHWEG